MILGEYDLPKAAMLALAARNRGERFIEFEIEASSISPFHSFVNLWGSVIGRRLGPVGSRVKVQVACVNVIEQYRRWLLSQGVKPTDLQPQEPEFDTAR